MLAKTLKDFSTNQWHNVKLQFAGDIITGFVDGAPILRATNSLFSRGMAGLVTGGAKTRNTAFFDNLSINALGAASNQPTAFNKRRRPIYDR